MKQPIQHGVPVGTFDAKQRRSPGRYLFQPLSRQNEAIYIPNSPFLPYFGAESDLMVTQLRTRLANSDMALGYDFTRTPSGAPCARDPVLRTSDMRAYRATSGIERVTRTGLPRTEDSYIEPVSNLPRTIMDDSLPRAVSRFA